MTVDLDCSGKRPTIEFTRARRPQAGARRVERRVYVQHGHGLMGCKSPVGGFNVDCVVDAYND